MTDRPLFELWQVLPDAPVPARAGGRYAGSLPAKAHRYCPPLLAATELGYHIYPALDLALRFDGQQVDWIPRDGTTDDWRRIVPGTEADVPSWTEHWLEHAPSRLLEADPGPPTLFNADPAAPNRIEMYTGTVVRTAPGWATLVRPPANVPTRRDLRLYEGIIDTDWWCAPLPTILEITEPGVEVELRRFQPLAQLQPVPKQLLDPAGDWYGPVGRIQDVPADVWGQMAETRGRRVHEERLGSYHREMRRRRRATDEVTGTSS